MPKFTGKASIKMATIQSFWIFLISTVLILAGLALFGLFLDTVMILYLIPADNLLILFLLFAASYSILIIHILRKVLRKKRQMKTTVENGKLLADVSGEPAPSIMDNSLPRSRKKLFFYLSSVILYTFLWIYLITSITNEVDKKYDLVIKMKKDLSKYNESNKEIERIKNYLEMLNIRIAVIRNLKPDRHQLVNLLDIIESSKIAEKMFFTDIGIKRNIVNLKGIAFDEKVVADFMKQLRISPAFQKPSGEIYLLNVEQYILNDRIMKLFEIEGTGGGPKISDNLLSSQSAKNKRELTRATNEKDTVQNSKPKLPLLQLKDKRSTAK